MAYGELQNTLVAASMRVEIERCVLPDVGIEEST